MYKCTQNNNVNPLRRKQIYRIKYEISKAFQHNASARFAFQHFIHTYVVTEMMIHTHTHTSWN